MLQTNSTYGQFEDLFILLPVPIALLTYEVRDLIEKIIPNAIETPIPKENHADYALPSGQRHDVFAYLCPTEKNLRLGFYYGDILPDPAGLLLPEGKRQRYLALTSPAEAHRSEVRALLLAAIQERRTTLGDR
ncbi:MAG: hypothetical protein H6636_04060 [Anaerolineales bacterium]|nr:hypothetical protein [Anaerolineales bacterium]